MNKRGLSGVVETVLIVLLTIVAIGLIARFVVPYVQNGLTKGSECIDYTKAISFESSEYDCYMPGHTLFAIKFGQVKEGQASSLRVVLSNDETSMVLSINNTGTESCEVGGIRRLDHKCTTGLGLLRLPAAGEIISYAYTGNNAKPFTKAELYQQVSSGTICKKSDEISLDLCSEGVLLNDK